MPLLFRAVNPGAQTAIWPEAIDYKLDRFADKPATLSLDIAGDTGLGARAVVDAFPSEVKGAANLGDSVFRGYVMPFSTNASGIAKITVPSVEKILDGRWAMPARYEAGTTIQRILDSGWPTDGKPAGLLCMASHLTPPGSFRLLSGSVWRLPQGGSSYLGDLSSKHVYINSVKQTFGSSTSLSSGQYFQDSDNLYIFSSTDPATRLVLVEGCLDTTIRLGSIAGGTATFTRSWRVGSGKIQSEIARLLDSAGLEYLYDYNGDGQTYLIAGSTVGRGENATYRPTYKYTDCDIVHIRRNTTAGNAPAHVITGMGIGKGSTRQAYSEVSFPQGLRFVDRVEYQSMFSDQLAGTVGKIYTDRQEQDGYQIETDDDPAIRPLDWVKIEPENAAPVVSRVVQVTNSATAPMKIYVGQRPKTAEDLVRAKLDAKEALQHDLDLEFTAINCNGQENLDNTTPCDIVLDVPAGTWDDELDSEWLMSIKLTAFESSAAGGSIPPTNHGLTGSEQYTGADGAHKDHDLNTAGSVGAPNTHTLVGYLLNSDETESDGGTTHTHGLNAAWAGLADDEHGHFFGDETYPGTADDHEDHFLDVNPGADSVISMGVNRADGFGSLAYLTVSGIVINSLYPSGAAIPGLPYDDIAINETISDLDVRGLITTGQNTIRISIQKYGGVGDVKARAHVSLTGKVAINNY